MTVVDLKDKPLTLELADGALVSLCQLDATAPTFTMATALRAAVKPLLAEHPERIALAVIAKKQASLYRLERRSDCAGRWEHGMPRIDHDAAQYVDARALPAMFANHGQ
ncbi:conserved hypothetical protein [Ricinus communis]|uniref:Uncharacterized protein n=1 Tax=Ricinus communis TaxID=3988 RepID=B9T9M4_RICCO|nr:conserved hypothetical protein [Ricinus communis]